MSVVGVTIMDECETTEQSGNGSGFDSGSHLPGSSTAKPERDRFLLDPVGEAGSSSVGQK